MTEKDEYSKWTLEDLITEEKKVKRKEITSSVLIGFLMGVIIYGVARNGFGFLYIFIPLLLIAGIYRNSQKLRKDLEEIRTAINSKP